MADQRPWEPTDEEVQALRKRSRKASPRNQGHDPRPWAPALLDMLKAQRELEARDQRQTS